MRPALLSMVAVVACGGSAPPARSPTERASDAAPAITALRAARFADASRDATTALAVDPHNAQAAAVRAIAEYQEAGNALALEIVAIIDKGEIMHALDHERGRRMWGDFLAHLDSVDRDLAVVAADPNFSLELCMACWEHDWNRNGRIDERDRKLFEIEYDETGNELPEGDPRRRPTFRFDVGDAEWARAMIAFQRAAVELILAYKWTALDQLFRGKEPRLVISLLDRERVRRARELVLAGTDYADRARVAYLAETDDDREWVPNPKQKSHPVPLAVDDALYATWAGVIGDVHRLLASDDGISLREVAALLGERKLSEVVPDAYIDVGAMLRDPTDIVIAIDEHGSERATIERLLRGMLGHGYKEKMRASLLPGRLHRMREDIVRGDESFEHKLRYLLWLN